MSKIIVGRTDEQKVLKELFQSKEAQFLAVTGRRRIGKTYLIKSFFTKEMSFDFSGLLNADMDQQLQNFGMSLKKYFKLGKNTKLPQTWLKAFHLLSQLLDQSKKKQKQVIFIDELPWLDTHKSGFVAALDWFWNSWAADKNVLLIVCGSSTSWMISKFINHTGGLHNRVTKRIHLAPFSLGETKKYLKHNKILLSDYQILQIYMAFGGVPHYLKEIKKGESSIQAIERICFRKNGLLVNEFDNLYKALFKKSEHHLKVVHALASRSSGLTRAEILKITKLKDGGTFSKILEELEWCNFIHSQSSFGKVKKETVYRLMDEYSLFYLKFIYKKKNVNWMQLAATSSWKIWSGYAYENICFKHIPQIKRALGISGVYSETYSFIHAGNKNEPGTQIDLLIDRNDKVINVCEVKFYDHEVTIDKKYVTELKNKLDVFKKATQTRKTLFLTMITTYGVKENTHSTGLVQLSLTMNDLYWED
jgi:AAA+ ATPase superfamily predicted ATPase